MKSAVLFNVIKMILGPKACREAMSLNKEYQDYILKNSVNTRMSSRFNKEICISRKGINYF